MGVQPQCSEDLSACSRSPDADAPTAEVRKMNVPVMLDFIGEVRTGVEMPEAACEQQKQERTNHFN